VIRQPFAAGRVDERVNSTAPVILGGGKPLFRGFDHDVDLTAGKVYSSPYATHVRYTVVK
jgi:dihydrofolate reductase